VSKAALGKEEHTKNNTVLGEFQSSKREHERERERASERE
jgi:hypothetical protein